MRERYTLEQIADRLRRHFNRRGEVQDPPRHAEAAIVGGALVIVLEGTPRKGHALIQLQSGFPLLNLYGVTGRRWVKREDIRLDTDQLAELKRRGRMDVGTEADHE